MTHRDTRILVVLVLALGSLSTGTAQVPEEINRINQAVLKIQVRELPAGSSVRKGFARVIIQIMNMMGYAETEHPPMTAPHNTQIVRS